MPMRKENALVSGFKSLGAAVKSIAGGIITPSEYRRDANGFWYFLEGKGHNFKYTGCDSALVAYKQCPPLATVINRKVQAFSNGKLWIMDMDGKEVEISKYQWLYDLLEQPNPLQSGDQWRSQLYAYLQIYGWCPVLKIKPTGYKKNSDIYELWNLPTNMVDIELTKRALYQNGAQNPIKSIVLNWEGQRVSIPADDIYIFQDSVPAYENQMFPDSRIKVLEYPISNIMGAYESRQEIINHRGARGIITNRTMDSVGNVPIPDDEKDALEKNFKGRYGMLKGMSQFIITNANIDYVPVGQSIKDLMLFEEIEADKFEIFDAYGFPADLASKSKESTRDNKKQARADFYQDTIIPESKSLDSQLNKMFGTYEMGIRLEYDYSHIPALQEDRKAQAESKSRLADAVLKMYKNKIVTLNRAREIMEEDTVPGDDVYYEPSKNNGNGEQDDTETGFYPEEAPPVDGEEESQS